VGIGSGSISKEVHLAFETAPAALLAINEVLDDFAREDPVKAELVKLRFFAGLSLPQAAQTLGLSLATAKRSWAFSRAWLYRHLTKSG
jgi:DNA-directed RNA polymerase specialized sigma24 family protein